ncbi:hypothetical protein ACR79P_05090 [Sphingobacterium spiritivorum]|uniref:hypothetical protein n=1 Tax=Sphingobacterium spiritivorum TaxID=258 RepID=UPI003DA3CC2D
MTAKEFVNRINKAQLSFEFLQSRVNKDYAESILRRGTIPVNVNKYIEQGNEILNLVLNYDLDKFDIFDIGFDKDLEKIGDDIYFGWTGSGERLGFNKFSKEVFKYYIYTD